MEKRNKEHLFENLFQENKDKIYRLCCGYFSDDNDVDDLFQEIMLNIWKNLDSFRAEAKISTWIYRIAVNTALLFSKRQQRNRNLFLRIEPEIFIPQTKGEVPDPHQQLELENLQRCITSLAKQDRLLVSMLLDGLSYKEMAEILGMSVSHVGVKINRIKHSLAELMKEASHGKL
ncbi:MAG: RNA polymerase sigma factor [Deferribacteres bacterium]|nr:RNA polymerase sigma factor [candidate division KSB1 bacterium]MCB9500322.1 RNA polymerase sigma factor [Deferribacteres bacterium]